MFSKKYSTACLALAGLLIVLSAISGCAIESGRITNYNVPEDVGQALDALPRIDSVETGAGNIPVFVTGDLGLADRVADVNMAQASLAPALAGLAPVFRLAPGDLVARRVDTDELGMTHVRYQQLKNGLEVVGGQLIVHVAPDGVVVAATASARGEQVSATPALAADSARQKAAQLTPGIGAVAASPDLVYVISSADGAMRLAWRSRVTGTQPDGTPVDDEVFVDAQTGALADRHPHIHTAKNRQVYDGGGGSSLPGTLRRSEGQAANGDQDINAAYDNTGTTYDCLKTKFNRDSYNNNGATLRSTVHHRQNYVNAFWNGSQMVYGDGASGQALPLARSLDVTAHELTHAVTEYTAGLIYANESGALNEAMSDIIGAACEAWKDGGVSADTWKLGEDIWTPNTPGDALRYMDNPTADGQSYDYYPQRYTGTADNGGVHLNSGIANLAFKLLVTGGTHPRNKTTVQVPGIGIEKAEQIFYRALATYMTQSTNFAGARTATRQAATDLYGADAACAVEKAWAAVGVGSVPSCDGGGGGGGGGEPPPPPPPPPPGGGDTVLSSGVAVSGQSGAKDAMVYYRLDVPAGTTSVTFQISGGTGDADLYVKAGAKPTLSVWDARPYRNGNSETATLTVSAAGSYYVMLHGYTAFSGVTIVGTATAGGGGGGGGNVLQNGVPVTGLSGATGTTKTYTFTVPAGASSLKFQLAGGTGDADLYVRFGAAPTTSTWDYRPYLNGNAETVNATPTAGTWYVMVRGYTAYSGVSLTATSN